MTAATFERALCRLDQFHWRPGGFGPWLFRIAANELVDHYRREERRRAREHAAVSRLATAPPTDHAPDLDADDQLLVALSTLSPRYQQVLSLQYLADLAPSEVAEAAGVSRSHLAVLLHRARSALRRALAKERP